MEDRQLLALMSAIIYASPDEDFKEILYMQCVEAARELLKCIDHPEEAVRARNSRVKPKPWKY